MGWLLVEKILPPLIVGNPPSYETILAAQKNAPPAGWQMKFNDRQLGWALNLVSRRPNGVTEIHSRVHFNEIPLQSLAHGWARTLLQLADMSDIELELDADSTAVIDPLGRLMRFESALRVDSMEKPIRVLGTIDGNRLNLEVRAGGLPNTTTTFLPANAIVVDAFSPQSQLPGLRAGQTWTVPVYSPLRPSGNPLEILHATVEGADPIVWDERTEHAWLVVYRNDPGAGLGSNDSPRGRLWVRSDGTVLKQQVMILDSTM
ncbi:MAG TPA: hypothetical protein VE890_08070, partial [Thermoguttaceae bacterium]|nr:hypothetical protein [Thermoguttaceae bacterium]